MTATSLVFTSTDDGVLVGPRHCGLLAIPDFLRQVVLWCATRQDPLVVDLSEVEDIDVGAFESFRWAHEHCRSRGLDLTVVAPPPGVLSLQEEALLRQCLHRQVPALVDSGARLS